MTVASMNADVATIARDTTNADIWSRSDSEWLKLETSFMVSACGARKLTRKKITSGA